MDACFHAFCFNCITCAAELAGNKCPMCKTVLEVVIHNVRANDDYDTVCVCACTVHMCVCVCECVPSLICVSIHVCPPGPPVSSLISSEGSEELRPSPYVFPSLGIMLITLI